MNLVEKALRIAVLYHKDQKRKVDNLPYIVHPVMVALKLAKYGFDDVVIAAALVHDILEDTDFTKENLEKELGPKVLEIVESISHDDNIKDWVERKKRYIQKVRNASFEAKIVSLADKIHNLESLLIAYEQLGPSVWDKFNTTKDKKIWAENELLEMYKQTLNHPLVIEYQNLVNKINQLL
jgi:(p)ppGpp synthase/HD superfamily hydrolase